MQIKPYTVTTNDGNVRHFMHFNDAETMRGILGALYPHLKPELTIKEVSND